MKADIDAMFRWVGFGNGSWYDWDSQCRVRVWRRAKGTVAVMSDLDEEDTGTSVTNSVENVMTLVRRQFELTDPIQWVEHYPRHNRRAELVRRHGWERAERMMRGNFLYREEFALVTATWDGRRYRHPDWEHLSADELLHRLGIAIDLDLDMDGCDALPLTAAQVRVGDRVVER
ncbi:hypothetical protein [Lyngbya sp. CCY1209]|uniref:hypothetical protein n=1 Tax=Lyngbya sp. CCY1209 TaxID=2886103 RepID=UPI002D208DB6|nr:hypothetical protein [Lyngbya sp. CCY1209]MEB3884053.1 hypothetical protein [Lyngbya sp. CCY1209]